jgi:hypothetical protein
LATEPVQAAPRKYLHIYRQISADQTDQMSRVDFTAAVRQLREMFPEHSLPTIEAVLLHCHGRVNSATTQLLNIPPDAVPVQPKPIQSSPPQHIFPPDFLRWPPDAPVIREDITTAGQRSAPAPIPGADLQFRMEPVQTRPSAEKPKGVWAAFKARFKKPKQYSRL